MRSTCVLELKSPPFSPQLPQVSKEFAQKAVLVYIFPCSWQGLGGGGSPPWCPLTGPQPQCSVLFTFSGEAGLGGSASS